MNRVAIAFSTKDRVELSKRTIEPLLQSDKFDTFWFDGSDTEEGQSFPFVEGNPVKEIRHNVRGGADAAIVYALTEMLSKTYTHSGMKYGAYTHVGLVENDVLLQGDWYEKTVELFEIGQRDGLRVGAVSARCYEDRILIQRPDYAITHNVGAGMVIFTEFAARLILKHFRTGWTNANRLLFSQLSGIDIGSYWAFRGGLHACTADWHWDSVLAAHGLAVCALTPSPVEMIGQVPSLKEQGLTLATKSVTDRIDDDAFQRYCDCMEAVREGKFKPAWPGLFHSEGSGCVIFPHHLPYIGGSYRNSDRIYGDWFLKWAMGFGPFTWKAGEDHPQFHVPILGACDILISGGEKGGKVKVIDKSSGFEASPTIQPEGDQGQVLALNVPLSCGYREIEVTCLSPGVIFYGIKCREPQPYNPTLSFDHSWLPPCG